MEEERVELERGVRVGEFDLFPISRALRHSALSRYGVNVCLIREALGVVVRASSGLQALMADGRTLALEDLLAVHPSLRDAVTVLQPGLEQR